MIGQQGNMGVLEMSRASQPPITVRSVEVEGEVAKRGASRGSIAARELGRYTVA